MNATLTRSQLDDIPAGLVQVGMEMWWHGEVVEVLAVQLMKPTPRHDYPKAAITLNGYPRQLLLNQRAKVSAAHPAAVNRELAQ